MPSDPLEIRLTRAMRRWPRRMQEKLTAGLTPAGVLIPLVEGSGGLRVLLTQRSEKLTHHAGQISFPGGRMEAPDPDIRATALRETWEEVGILPSQVETIGYLPPMPTITQYAVTAVVGVVAAGAELTIDRREVDEVFEVPLDFLLDASNQRHSERELGGARVPIIEYRYESWRIWGATAMMVAELRKKIHKEQ